MTRFGLQLPSFTFADVPDDRLFERIAEIAKAAEGAGFDSFWVMDHYHQIAQHRAAHRSDARGLHGARRRRGPDLPDQARRDGHRRDLSQPRVPREGRHDARHRLVGPRDPRYRRRVERRGVPRLRLRLAAAGERFERLEDALQICRSMFTQPRSTLKGRVHHVDGAINVPQPVQPGGPKILIGGGGERKTLRLVAKYADMWNGFGDSTRSGASSRSSRATAATSGATPPRSSKTRLGTLIVAQDGRGGRRASRGVQDATGRGRAMLASADLRARRTPSATRSRPSSTPVWTG